MRNSGTQLGNILPASGQAAGQYRHLFLKKLSPNIRTNLIIWTKRSMWMVCHHKFYRACPDWRTWEQGFEVIVRELRYMLTAGQL